MTDRHFLPSLALVLAACGGGGGLDCGDCAAPRPGRYALERAYAPASFDRPLAVLAAPGDDHHLYVAQQDGLILRLDTGSPAARSLPYLDLRDRTRASGEQGLLGVAFDPNYAVNRRLYVNYSANRNPDVGNGDTVIARFNADLSGQSANPASELQLLRYPQPFSNHNGGAICFGPEDGLLYVASGDGGDANDPQNNAQNLGSLLGKILRIAPDGLVPGDNPFAATPGARPEIWAYGLRNPFRMSFDAPTGRLWAGDVGQGAQEEIDVIERGGNYGWRVFEGTRRNTGEALDFLNTVAPVFTYLRSEGRSVTGGVVYRGQALPELRGHYIYGDFVSGRIWALQAPEGVALDNLQIASADNPSSFGVDLDGEILVTAFDGNLYRLVRDDGAGP